MEGRFIPVILPTVFMTLCRVFLAASVELPNPTVMPALPTMTTYISELEVSLNKEQQQNLMVRGFTQIPKDLNKGVSGNYIYLWYKMGPTPITRLQVSFNDNTSPGLTSAGYTKIKKDLNAGAGGDYIYLWYYRGSGEFDTPIVGIDVTSDSNNEAAKFHFGWERLDCDLNRKVKGAWIHLWVKRETQTYVCDITATDSYGTDSDLLKRGYIRVDEDTNRGAGGSSVFIWYRQTTDPKRALTDLQVSTSTEESYTFQQQGFTLVNVNLNDETGGNPVHMLYKKGGTKNPIKAIVLIVNDALITDYREAGLIVIAKNLNTGNQGSTEHLCFYQ